MEGKGRVNHGGSHLCGRQKGAQMIRCDLWLVHVEDGRNEDINVGCGDWWCEK